MPPPPLLHRERPATSIEGPGKLFPGPFRLPLCFLEFRVGWGEGVARAAAATGREIELREIAARRPEERR